MTEHQRLTRLIHLLRKHYSLLEAHDEEGLSANFETTGDMDDEALASYLLATEYSQLRFYSNIPGLGVCLEGCIMFTPGEGEDLIQDFADTPFLRDLLERL